MTTFRSHPTIAYDQFPNPITIISSKELFTLPNVYALSMTYKPAGTSMSPPGGWPTKNVYFVGYGFTYDGNMNGTVTELSESENGVTLGRDTDVNLPMKTIINAIITNQSANALIYNGDDYFIGSTGNDNLYAYAGNDIIYGGGGSDRIGGGTGFDTFVTYGNYSDYTFSNQNLNTEVVTIKTSGMSTILTSIESVRFDDRTVAFADLIPPVITVAPSNSTSKSHTLSILVDKNILGANAVLLKNLAETIVSSNDVITSHSFVYGGFTYDYNIYDSIITTVTRDGDFTSEFRQEIAAYAPGAENLSYNTVVSLVGVANIDSILISVAGADGSYVS